MGIVENVLRHLFSSAPRFIVLLLAVGMSGFGRAASPPRQSSTVQQIWDGLLPFLAPADRANLVFIGSHCETQSIPSSLAKDIWQAPGTPDGCYLHHTGEKFSLRKITARPLKLLLFAPKDGASAEDIAMKFGAEFRARSGPYQRVLSRLPTPFQTGFSWLSVGVQLPGEIDISELDDDNACVYCGGWGGHGGAVDAGFVHSKARHDWALFVRREIAATDGSDRTGETFSFRTRFKEDQNVKLTLYVPKNDMVAVTATGVNEHGALVTQTLVVAIDRQFQWRTDGRANILKRITTLAQDHENFAKNEKVVGVHWHSPTNSEGPCRIGWSWHNNHDWAAKDSTNEAELGTFETWPLSYNGRKVVFVDEISAGEETDGIVLTAAQARSRGETQIESNIPLRNISR